MPFARRAAREHRPVQDIEGGKQVRRAVPNVVMGLTGRNAGPQRQHRLGAVERLHLRLFVDAEHQRPIGRMQIDADHVAQLLDEVRIATELERLDAMRLQIRARARSDARSRG